MYFNEEITSFYLYYRKYNGDILLDFYIFYIKYIVWVSTWSIKIMSKFPKFFSKKISKEKMGKFAESLVEIYIESKNFKVVTRNYRYRGGELDLIAWDDDQLVFIEVRSKHNTMLGPAIASITPEKRRRIINTAKHFLASLDFMPICRFDLATIDYREGCYMLCYHENFFHAAST